MPAIPATNSDMYTEMFNLKAPKKIKMMERINGVIEAAPFLPPTDEE